MKSRPEQAKTAFGSQALWAAVGLVVFVTIWHNITASNRERAAKDQLSANEQARRMRLIEQLAYPLKADYKWISRLVKGNDFRLQPLMTAELQEVWHVNSGRILFVGRLLDVDALNDGDFIVLLEHMGLPRFRETLKVQALCGPNSREAIQVAMAEVQRTRLSPQIAIAMEVRAIEKIAAASREDKDSFIGKGLCLTAQALTDWTSTGPHYPPN